jgi:hypothetical protein
MIPIKFTKGQDRRPDSEMTVKLARELPPVQPVVAAVDCPPCPPPACATTFFKVIQRLTLDNASFVEKVGLIPATPIGGGDVIVNFDAVPTGEFIDYTWITGSYPYPDEVLLSYVIEIQGNLCAELSSTQWLFFGGGYGAQSLYEGVLTLSFATTLTESSLGFVSSLRATPLVSDGEFNFQFPIMGVNLTQVA